MVMDAAEPRDYEIRALCMQCGQVRSKKVSAKPENEEGEEMAFLMEITRNTELLSAVDWSDFDDQAWKETLAPTSKADCCRLPESVLY